jgi:hypothetical protein
LSPIIELRYEKLNLIEVPFQSTVVLLGYEPKDTGISCFKTFVVTDILHRFQPQISWAPAETFDALARPGSAWEVAAEGLRTNVGSHLMLQRPRVEYHLSDSAAP